MTSRILTWRALFGLLGLAAVLICVALALVHLRDLSRVQHIVGVWMGLGAALDQGTLYPALEQAGHYGGTRYMPVIFALIALLSRLTGDLLVAAKLTALLTTLALAVSFAVVVRRLTRRWTDVVVMTAVLLVLPEVLNALRSPHADALAAALAIWALWLIEEKPSWGRLTMASVLFALAVLTKFSAITGAAAAGLWLFAHGQRARAVWVVGLSATLALVGVVLVNWASDGRMLDNFRNLASGGMSGESVAIGPGRMLLVLVRLTPFLLIWPVALWLLTPWRPIVAVGLRESTARSASESRDTWRWGIWEWYLFCALGVTAVILTSPGTEFNHLVEFQAACLIVLAGQLFGPSHAEESATKGRQAGVRFWLPFASCFLAAVAIVWGVGVAMFTADPSAIPVSRLSAALPAKAHILAEDASIPLILGQRPVVLDPFSFRLLAERGLIDPEALARRIRVQEFDALVMLAPLEPPDSLCPQFHFGQTVTEAMRRGYKFDRGVGRYYIYRRAGPLLAGRQEVVSLPASGGKPLSQRRTKPDTSTR